MDITPAIKYEPEINNEQLKVPTHVLLKQQKYIDYVDQVISKEIGASTTQHINEVKRTLQNVQGRKIDVC
jgi:hypothetical protein